MTTMQIEPRSVLQRLTKVIRLNFANPWSLLITPLIILGFLLSVTFVLGALNVAFVSSVEQDLMFSPEIFLIIFLFVAANQTLYHQFPLALSYGISRRDFYFGTLVTFALLSVWYALVSSGLKALRDAFFFNHLGTFADEQFFGLIWTFLASQLLAASITTIYLRWQRIGMFVFFGLLAVLFAATPFTLYQLQVWDQLVRLTGVDLRVIDAVLWSSIVAFVIATIGYLIIKRARVD